MPGAPKAASAWAFDLRHWADSAPLLTHRTMFGRLVHKADFERLLATRFRARSAHFALHHVSSKPTGLAAWVPGAKVSELSTVAARSHPQPVDDSIGGVWIGCVVPKRHARRSVTRSLLKRQIRACFERQGSLLPAGLWLIRLRAAFTASEFVSARSAILAQAARAELDGLLSQAA